MYLRPVRTLGTAHNCVLQNLGISYDEGTHWACSVAAPGVEEQALLLLDGKNTFSARNSQLEKTNRMAGEAASAAAWVSDLLAFVIEKFSR